ncbi:dihydrodipicolinate synthase family protein [Fulvivirgaceae bacterium BMA10]|uniref:Dihydrodipicolinate synthase family protein n=1 Tax=Splendidivirga corallicola TaxID=3051826 RepID=A0ABT8KIL0_9BACT|nr:dihydrodipicolinate synthase family protein [Fulvivirgaceae bacterium BMA10]
MEVKWQGVYPAVTTKFTNEDKLDIPAFVKNIEAQVEAGVDGIILGGTLGEASALSEDEKAELVKTTIEVVDYKLPVILNIAEQTTKGAIATAISAKENGASGLMLLPPMRYKADDRETVEYFKAVATSTDLPIMIYNNPIDYGIKVTLEMFDELQQFSNIQAVKESTRDVTNVIRMRNAFDDRFKILCGVDTLAYETIAASADGWVAGLVCAFPKETVAIYKLIKAGRHEEALSIYQWFMPLLELDIHPKLVQYIKLAEVATGLGTENVRPPRLPLIGEERERILKIIKDALAVRPALPDLESIEMHV